MPQKTKKSRTSFFMTVVGLIRQNTIAQTYATLWFTEVQATIC
jgi:hypothetical protein